MQLLEDLIKSVNGAATTTSSSGKGFKNKKIRKKLNIIRGRGMVIENAQENKKPTEFYELNKFLINIKELENNICDMRYSKNKKKFRQFNIPNENIKNIRIKLCKDNEFSVKEYEKLNEDNKNFILKFCESCHVDVGFSNSVKELEQQMAIYEGEAAAGNAAPMIKFLLDSVYKGNLSKADYLTAINEMIKSY